jgi:RNA-binding protein
MSSASPNVISAPQKRFLRGLAHDLKPLIQVGGKGVTDSLLAELELTLERHELVKVRIAAADRETRDTWIAELTARSGAALIQRVGHIATLYRVSSEKPQIVLPR